ncbi:hypothetical protein SAPIO_CDS1685 [Scedosporium apiospermum]|uniref:Uncharacterized protein n=1 Tax=Pseudallescheria apiosperma TaxID=563466 RepID=A0A084GDI4_PSEDA|nr:uncharacterized protein SAPIO_CDS1685 [Scedosporium apiospermum]KEZ45396.1 hypothetical protein SAPIO_CDS1685 [Scedosporium apiospermum]
MAGHAPLDPAIVRAAEMHSKRHLYFRWTPRTARITLMYVVVVPSIIGYLAYKTDGLWDFRAKRRGDTVYER